MANLKVDQETCIGCGACVGTCPNTFEFTDEMKARVIENKDCQGGDDCDTCLDLCPVHAISKD